MRLVLFDIDGTILTSGGSAGRAFLGALEEVFGGVARPEEYSFAGKTDPQIARELLVANGWDEEAVSARLPDVWPRYVGALTSEIRTAQVRVFEGIAPLLDRLEESEATLGLLTGNLREGARIKLAAAGIDPSRFAVGAFGSDHADRRELPAVAIERAEALVGRRYAGKEVVIIGDTPADIACGEHLGVRTIAVATGSYPPDALRACGPDHLFETLADTEAVWRAIFGS